MQFDYMVCPVKVSRFGNLWEEKSRKRKDVVPDCFSFHVKDLGTTAWTAGVCEHKNPVFTAVAYDVPAVLSDIAASLVSQKVPFIKGYSKW